MIHLAAHDLHYSWRGRFDQIRAVKGISADFSGGQAYFLCGPSGSGKTTLAMLLAGLLVPDSGNVKLDARVSTPQLEHIAYVFQFPENIYFEDSIANELNHIAGESKCQRAKEILSDLGIRYEDVSTKHPYHLSDGQSRLVATALQVARDTPVLILDEPTIGLDWVRSRRIMNLLQQQISDDRIVITVTHDVDLMKALGGRTHILADGFLVWEGDTQALLREERLLREYGLIA